MSNHINYCSYLITAVMYMSYIYNHIKLIEIEDNFFLLLKFIIVDFQ